MPEPNARWREHVRDQLEVAQPRRTIAEQLPTLIDTGDIDEETK